jgi:hypothetical protein
MSSKPDADRDFALDTAVAAMRQSCGKHPGERTQQL